jgi:hypothetical protein
MYQIQHLTLLVAIQAIDTEIGRMSDELDAHPSEDDGGELESRLLKYTKAAADLKLQYEEARKSAPHMLPYERLAKNS